MQMTIEAYDALSDKLQILQDVDDTLESVLKCRELVPREISLLGVVLAGVRFRRFETLERCLEVKELI